MFFISIKNQYIAIIGDIKKSKQLEERKKIQIKLQAILNEINIKYTEDIVSKFMITLGDEFQGVLECGVNVMNIISEIEAEIYPIEIRYGIGIGDLTTDINPDIPLGADGPAYYYARDAIEFLKMNEKKSKAPESSIMIMSDNENASILKLLNTVLALETVIKNNWTERQREIIQGYIHNEENQIKTADSLSITQSSVQKSLSNANYYTYKEAKSTVSEALAEIRRRQDV
ncbi:MAG: SatD family protein [Mobilitalea sp.]